MNQLDVAQSWRASRKALATKPLVVQSPPGNVERTQIVQDGKQEGCPHSAELGEDEAGREPTLSSRHKQMLLMAQMKQPKMKPTFRFFPCLSPGFLP